MFECFEFSYENIPKYILNEYIHFYENYSEIISMNTQIQWKSYILFSKFTYIYNIYFNIENKKNQKKATHFIFRS